MNSVIVITLNYNKSDYTIKCVESILKSDYYDFKTYPVESYSSGAGDLGGVPEPMNTVLDNQHLF